MSGPTKISSLRQRAKSLLKGQSLRDPLDFLSPKRIDIAAKTIYAKAYLENNTSPWPEYVYKEHIRAFNNFYEAEPLKVDYEAFKNSFHNTLDNIETLHEWSHLAPVWVNESTLINGSHRIAAAAVSGRKISSIRKPLTNHNKYNHDFFKSDRNGIKRIDEDVLDYMTIEYVSLKKQNVFAAIVFPAAEGHRQDAYNHLLSLGEIINMKSFPHDTFIGKEVIKQLYFNSNNDAWNVGNDFEGSINKSRECFNGNGDLQVYLIEANLDESTRIKEKEYLRGLWKKDKHSIHVSDTVEEANRIARMFFNKNSREFMTIDRKSEFMNEHSSTLFNTYVASLPNDVLEREKFAIEGSFVLDVHGIREAKDLDYISRSDTAISRSDDIERHTDKENIFHTESVDEILTNPKYYFYYKGYKIITLDEMREYKAKRFTIKKNPKDNRDVELMERFNASVSRQSNVKQPLISVIIPVYNVELFLHKCIESVLDQTYVNTEVILVDDGSTDTSGTLCDQISKNHPNVSVVHKKNAGLNMARKSGLDKAAGDYILFVDSDDFIHPESIEVLYGAMVARGVDVAVGGYRYFSDEIEIADRPSVKRVGTVVEYDADVLKKWLIRGAPYDGVFMQTAWMKLFKRDTLLSIDWDECNYRSNEDEFMALQYYQTLRNGMAFVSEPLYYYRVNNDSITRSEYRNEYKGRSLSKFNTINELYVKTVDIFGEQFRKDAITRFIQQYLIFLERYLEAGWLDSASVREFDELVKPKMDIIDGVYSELGDHQKKQYDFIKQYGLFGIAMFAIQYRDGVINELQSHIDVNIRTIASLEQPGVKTSLRKVAGATRRYIRKKISN